MEVVKMLRSLYSGVTGLRSHQIRMDVIGNNIANVNTAGFKASRVVFKDLYYQTISSSTAPNEVIGGTNPRQIGYGSAVASIDVQNTVTGISPTDISTDLYIAGDGYFMVQDGEGNANYTRVGNFTFDPAGYLVDVNGNFVVGIKEGAMPTDEVYDIDSVEPIIIDTTDNAYTEMAVGYDGVISALNSATGEIEVLGQVVIAKFNNTNALSQQGDNYFKPTQNSGDAILSEAGRNGTGLVISGGLEMSNVDLSKEFTDMIITQRGFQANSRVITTSDEILQELVNLKR